MTDRNDGRPRHSASHIHCAVPFFLCPKRNGGGGRAALRGMGCEVGEECIVQPAGARRRCGGERKCSGGACRCAGASEELRRGMGCEGGGEGIAQPAGVRRGCVEERKCSGRACAVRGRGEVFGGKWVVRSAGMYRAACGRASGLRGGAEVLGKGASLCGDGSRSSAGNGW